MTDKHVEQVKHMMDTRAAKGLEKYGVTTERTDITTYDWLIHLQEELLDAAIYAETLKEHFSDDLK